jgi:hypothetical protein
MTGETGSVRLDRLTVFCHLWAIAGIAEAARWMVPGTPWSWVLVPASLFLFAFPTSVPCLAGYALLQLSFHALATHSPWNHGLFMALANLAILISVARIYYPDTRRISGASENATREALLDHFAPTLRLSLILVYGFTFLHKLNWDFLDPMYSCAGTVLTWLNTEYHVLPTGRWLTIVGIWSTLVVESAVPLLLCFRRTVGIGLGLGFLFHLFLSQYGGLFGFAAVMYAVYYLFLPLSFTDHVGRRLENVFTRVHLERARPWCGLAIAATIVATAFAANVWRGSSALGVGRWWWNIWLLGSVVLYGAPLLSALRTPPAHRIVTNGWLGLIPLFVVISGISPYLGLKTETSWSMYSNLRTETRPNHIFVPRWLTISGYQGDLVTILETSHPELKTYQQQGLLLTYFEFRRICSATTEDFRVAYERDGQVRTLEVIDGVSNASLATRPHPWLADRLLRFRPVDEGDHMQCRH